MVVADMASNNDTMVEELENLLPGYNSGRRGFCIGHIINRIVKAIMFGEGISNFECQLNGASDKYTFDIWRKIGVIGRVHNVVIYIMRSLLRCQELAKCLKVELAGDEDMVESLDEIVTEQTAYLVKDGGSK